MSNGKLLDKAMTLLIHQRNLQSRVNIQSGFAEDKRKMQAQLYNEITEHERQKRNIFPELEDTGKALEILLSRVKAEDLPQFVSILSLTGEDTMEDIAENHRASAIINEFVING